MMRRELMWLLSPIFNYCFRHLEVEPLFAAKGKYYRCLRLDNRWVLVDFGSERLVNDPSPSSDASGTGARGGETDG